jgi:Tfp pilus assembly protein PilO
VRPFWQRRLLVPALVVAAANVIAYFAYTRPRSEFERDIATRAVTLREEVSAERARVERVRQRVRALETNAGDVGRFYEAIGRKDAVFAVQEDIVGLGRQLGLSIGSRSYANESVKGGKGLARFKIVMPVSGSYRQVATFLHRLESMRHFVTVEQVALREQAAAGGRGANLNITLSVYFIEDEPEADAS